MFAQVKSDFDDRVREVDLYFQLLAALDNGELAVVQGMGQQVVPLGTPPTDWGRMLKGTAYLILYNLVEAFVRRGFQAVFEAIKNDGLCGIQLTELFRTQWVEQKNRKVKAFDGSPKVYMKIANEIVIEIVDKKVARLHRDHLPFSGNLDADAIRDLCMNHGVSYTTPAAAKGGAQLETVKVKRNALSHGDESFVECGRPLVATDLIKAKDEVVLFMRSILKNLETFTANQGYKV